MDIVIGQAVVSFPEQVVVMCKETRLSNPKKAFRLKATVDESVDVIELDGALTLQDARRLARRKGYWPTHWMQTGDTRPIPYY